MYVDIKITHKWNENLDKGVEIWYQYVTFSELLPTFTRPWYDLCLYKLPTPSPSLLTLTCSANTTPSHSWRILTPGGTCGCGRAAYTPTTSLDRFTPSLVFLSNAKETQTGTRSSEGRAPMGENAQQLLGW